VAEVRAALHKHNTAADWFPAGPRGGGGAACSFAGSQCRDLQSGLKKRALTLSSELSTHSTHLSSTVSSGQVRKGGSTGMNLGLYEGI
jgi:hypothetical protein